MQLLFHNFHNLRWFSDRFGLRRNQCFGSRSAFVPPLLATLVDKTSTGVRVRATSMRTTVGTEWQSAHARSWTRDPLTTIVSEIRPESNSLPIIRNLFFNFRKFINILLPVRDVNSILRNIQQKFFTMNFEGTDYRVSGYLCPKTPNSPAEETSSICLFCRSLLSMLGGRAFCNSCTPISLLKKKDCILSNEHQNWSIGTGILPL